ncbi:hypothetical protein KKY_1279 [Pelagibacterium halotolerans B2]|uniref:Uncharacterized protein n=1 Tax=Pelagibacterium halotolerans (strain DSM 22347 / JCM 15775 / CGMCC 1.7692 / B2) TaxID=1082931 RepID=G4R826_PELHB|nr:hypothetical protein KKY_1279 [Pelagibacterium halotolerans B2]
MGHCVSPDFSICLLPEIRGARDGHTGSTRQSPIRMHRRDDFFVFLHLKRFVVCRVSRKVMPRCGER